MVSIALVDARKTSLTGVQNSQKNRLAATMVSIALVDARKTSLTGVQNSPKKIGSPLRGSWTMVSIALVDARKTSLMGVQNSKKNGSPRRRWVKPPPPLEKKARSAPDSWYYSWVKVIDYKLQKSWLMIGWIVIDFWHLHLAYSMKRTMGISSRYRSHLMITLQLQVLIST